MIEIKLIIYSYIVSEGLGLGFERKLLVLVFMLFYFYKI